MRLYSLYGCLNLVIMGKKETGYLFCSYIHAFSLLCSNLSSNHLTRLEESSFVGLSLLDELHIGNNRVSFIADGAFRGLSNLQLL